MLNTTIVEEIKKLGGKVEVFSEESVKVTAPVDPKRAFLVGMLAADIGLNGMSADPDEDGEGFILYLD